MTSEEDVRKVLGNKATDNSFEWLGDGEYNRKMGGTIMAKKKIFGFPNV